MAEMSLKARKLMFSSTSPRMLFRSSSGRSRRSFMAARIQSRTRYISGIRPKEKSLRSSTSMAPGSRFQTSSGQFSYQESIFPRVSPVMDLAWSRKKARGSASQSPALS